MLKKVLLIAAAMTMSTGSAAWIDQPGTSQLISKTYVFPKFICQRSKQQVQDDGTGAIRTWYYTTTGVFTC